MSHRKYRAPRHGSLAFLPRKRCTHNALKGRIRSFPADKQCDAPHLTAFIGFKAGMTHVVRDMNRVGSKLNNTEVCEAVTVIDCPPMVAAGIVGYIETPHGLRALTTVWIQHLAEEVRRRFVKNWHASKKQAFTRFMEETSKQEDYNKYLEENLQRMAKFCSVIRVIAHTQLAKTPLKVRKAHIMEIQVNGGSVQEKVDFAKSLLEKEINATDIFEKDESVDFCGITRGFGYSNVIKRYGIGMLPRKTRRGRNRVACIGAWHPSRVLYTVARTGQMGFHHRTIMNAKVYMVDDATKEDVATTPFDQTTKGINPMGGWPHYGILRNQFMMVRGGVTGPRKRPITIRKACKPRGGFAGAEKIVLKYVDTSSRIGHGRFQTSEEKAKFFQRK